MATANISAHFQDAAPTKAGAGPAAPRRTTRRPTEPLVGRANLCQIEWQPSTGSRLVALAALLMKGANPFEPSAGSPSRELPLSCASQRCREMLTTSGRFDSARAKSIASAVCAATFARSKQTKPTLGRCRGLATATSARAAGHGHGVCCRPAPATTTIGRESREQDKQQMSNSSRCSQRVCCTGAGFIRALRSLMEPSASQQRRCAPSSPRPVVSSAQTAAA